MAWRYGVWLCGVCGSGTWVTAPTGAGVIRSVVSDAARDVL
jgi:hypothetical protein